MYGLNSIIEMCFLANHNPIPSAKASDSRPRVYYYNSRQTTVSVGNVLERNMARSSTHVVLRSRYCHRGEARWFD